MNFYILAGGQSRRLGRNKALVDLNGQTIIEKVVSAIPARKENIRIVTSSFKTFQFLELKMIEDIHSGLGPIGGVYSGLIDAAFDFNFFIACDLPLITTELIQLVLNSHSGQDIFGVRTKRGLEPLCTLYSKSCIPAIESQVKTKDYSLHSLFKAVTSEFIETENSNLLLNINTTQDLEILKTIHVYPKN